MTMGAAGTGGTTQRIASIQMLRSITAALVVVNHTAIFTAALARRMGIDMPPPGISSGGRGDLFFIISGFVMIYSSVKLYGQPGARTLFWKRRLIRIAPLYWVATLTLAWWLWRVGTPGDPGLVIASLLFVPYSVSGDTGYIVPLIDAGWTLNYEVLFYLILGLSLSRNAKRTVTIVSCVLAALVLIGPLVSGYGAQLFTWTRPIIVQYIAGMVFALLVLRGVQLKTWMRWTMAVAGVALFLSQVWAHYPHWQGWQRTLGGGVPAVLVFAACVLGPMRLPFERFWERIGDTSYSLYIWHMPIFMVLTHLWLRFGIPYSMAGYATLALVTAYGVSAISYYGFERPVTRYFNARLTRRVPKDERLEMSGV